MEKKRRKDGRKEGDIQKKKKKEKNLIGTIIIFCLKLVI